jgi:hypothetical protein
MKKAFGWKPKHGDLGVICGSAYQWEVKLQGTSLTKIGRASA